MTKFDTVIEREITSLVLLNDEGHVTSLVLLNDEGQVSIKGPGTYLRPPSIKMQTPRTRLHLDLREPNGPIKN